MSMQNYDDFILDRQEIEDMQVWSCIDWLDEHMEMVDRYLRDRFHPKDYDGLLEMIFSKQYAKHAMKAIYDYFTDNKTKINAVTHYIGSGSKIIIVVGMRGGGKTCGVHYILRQVADFTDRPIYFCGHPQPVDERFFYEQDIFDTPEGSINVIDEGALIANSRESSSASNIGLSTVLPTLRHVDKTLIVITQNSASLDLNFMRYSDALLLKRFSLKQDITERENFYGSDVFFFRPKKIEEVYFSCDNFDTKYVHGVHPAWNDDLSKAFRKFESDEEALEYADKLHEQYYDKTTIRNLCRVRGFVKEIKFWTERYGRA